jgi:hypothetical protein
MSSVQKLFLSLLITLVLFTVFVFFSFSGLFNYIETHFYNVKIQKDIQRSLNATSAEIESYLGINQEKYKDLLNSDFLKTVYFLNQSREHIFGRENLFGKLLSEAPFLAGVRFIDISFDRIHFSTFSEDIVRRAPTNIEYRDFKDVENKSFIETLRTRAIEEPILLYGETDTFVYCYKVNDIYDKHVGYALFYQGKRGLQNSLLRKGLLEIGDQIGFVDGVGILLKSQQLGEKALEIVDSYWRNGSKDLLSFTLESGEPFVFFESEVLSRFKVGMFFPESLFGLNRTLKSIILCAVFLTLFLLLFLLLNIKQEPALIVSERIKKPAVTPSMGAF